MTSDKEDLGTKGWNRLEKKSHWLFYLVIGVVCFVLAWVMSGAIK